MTRSRIIALAAGAATLLLSAGTALALTSGDDGVPGSLTATFTGVTTSSTSEETFASTNTSSPTSAPVSTHVPTHAPTHAPAGPEMIGSHQAIRIALGHVGGGTVTRVERELEHGRTEWKVRIVKAGQRFDVRVDAMTGVITRIDGDDDGGGKRGRGGDDDGGNRGRGGDDGGGKSGRGGDDGGGKSGKSGRG